MKLMEIMKKLQEKSNRPEPVHHIIEIEVSDLGKDELLPVLKYFESMGNIGHSLDYSIEDDKFSWDGDGSSRIFNITVKTKN